MYKYGFCCHTLVLQILLYHNNTFIIPLEKIDEIVKEDIPHRPSKYNKNAKVQKPQPEIAYDHKKYKEISLEPKELPGATYLKFS